MERNEAIEVIKRNYPHVTESGSQFETALRLLIPELKESEDERIRGAIIDHLKDNNLTEWAAWLEKQGENNMGISEATKQKLEDNLNKALEKETPESLNKFLDEQGEQKPADKIESRQKELTEFEKAVKQVMEEAIECGDTHNLKADADMLLRLVQKSSWSEEDEEQLDRALYMMEQLNMTKSWDDVYNWLQSLKERYTWRPSYEQIKGIECAIKTLQHQLNVGDKRLNSLYDDLKKLMGK
jgi:phenylalanyl-tRNA synthetase alpha subunit